MTQINQNQKITFLILVISLKRLVNTKITDLENKICDVGDLATKTALTTVGNKIPNVSGLATKTELTTVENKTFM